MGQRNFHYTWVWVLGGLVVQLWFKGVDVGLVKEEGERIIVPPSVFSSVFLSPNGRRLRFYFIGTLGGSFLPFPRVLWVKFRSLTFTPLSRWEIGGFVSSVCYLKDNRVFST